MIRNVAGPWAELGHFRPPLGSLRVTRDRYVLWKRGHQCPIVGHLRYLEVPMIGYDT